MFENNIKFLFIINQITLQKFNSSYLKILFSIHTNLWIILHAKSDRHSNFSNFARLIHHHHKVLTTFRISPKPPQSFLIFSKALNPPPCPWQPWNPPERVYTLHHFQSQTFQQKPINTHKSYFQTNTYPSLKPGYIWKRPLKLRARAHPLVRLRASILPVNSIWRLKTWTWSSKMLGLILSPMAGTSTSCPLKMVSSLSSSKVSFPFFLNELICWFFSIISCFCHTHWMCNHWGGSDYYFEVQFVLCLKFGSSGLTDEIQWEYDRWRWVCFKGRIKYSSWKEQKEKENEGIEIRIYKE